MNLTSAIESFNSFRARPLNTQDLSKIEAVVSELNLNEFQVVNSGAYMRDADSVIHINPGFVVSKVPANGLLPDTTYAKEGFLYRIWLSGEAKLRKGETPSQRIHCPLCTGLPGDDHLLEECPAHP